MKLLKSMKLPTMYIEFSLFIDGELCPETVTAKISEKNGQIYCEDDEMFCAYDSEFLGCDYISKELEDWTVKNFGKGFYWEWENSNFLVLTN